MGAGDGAVIVPAQPGDFGAVAELFTEGFPESVRRIYGASSPDLGAISEGFRFVWSMNHGHVRVARNPDRGAVDGYIAVLPSIRGFWAQVVRSGFAARMLTGWLRGRYRLPLRSVPRVVLNKLAFVRGAGRIPRYDAQILSVAVRPAARGLGLGRALVLAGLEHLKAVGASSVKLEVRPDNMPARRTYESLGFRRAGVYDDSQGPWWIMVLDLV
jgi:ribosomal-protein-alanine N-acetyltransferase